MHEDIADAFVAELVEEANKLTCADPLDPASQVGPLASSAQYEKVHVARGKLLRALCVLAFFLPFPHSFVNEHGVWTDNQVQAHCVKAQRQGAQLVAGGSRPEEQSTGWGTSV